MLKKFKNAFITGLIILLPLSLTAYIMYSGFVFFDNILQNFISYILYKLAGWEFFADHTIPGVGLIALLLFTVIIGILARILIVSRIMVLGNRILNKIPLVNKVYITIYQISQALLSGQKDFFEKPVIIEYPRKGLYSIGFVTQDTKGPVQDALAEDSISVFLPTTPNPTSGYLLFVPKKDIIDVNLTTEEALKLVISGGMVIPDIRQRFSSGESE